jgi:hypothetical protein
MYIFYWSDLSYDSKTNTYSVNLYKLDPTSSTALALGSITLIKLSGYDNLFTIKKDKFNFDYQEGGSFYRNTATLIGGLLVFDQFFNTPITPWSIFRDSTEIGGIFDINFTGIVYIKP